MAGLFYPADPGELAAAVRAHLDEAPEPPLPTPPRALLSPHAGYVYSGPVAGSAYACVRGSGDRFRRAVLLGPSHRVAFEGMALPECDALATPLGTHPVDAEGARLLDRLPTVRRWGHPHRGEHALEVQLPFLHAALGPLPVLPIVTGRARPEEVAEALEAVWTTETLVVVSSDLSHYHPYAEARARDRRTAEAIERGEPDAVGPAQACGATALRGLLVAARDRGLTARCLDLRSSGDTAGSHASVVGYGAFGFWAAA